MDTIYHWLILPKSSLSSKVEEQNKLPNQMHFCRGNWLIFQSSKEMDNKRDTDPDSGL